MQLDAGVVRTGEASPTQTAGGHTEVASILLNDYIGSNLGSSEEGMLALINGKILSNPMLIGWILIVPTGFEFLQSDGIGTVAVNFIRRHVDEGCLRAGASRGLKHIKGTDGIGIKVIKGNRCRPVMTGLSCRMDDGVWLYLGNQLNNTLTITDVEFVVNESFEIAFEPMLVPAGITLGTKENGTLVVIDSVNVITKFLGKVLTHLGADQP